MLLLNANRRSSNVERALGRIYFQIIRRKSTASFRSIAQSRVTHPEGGWRIHWANSRNEIFWHYVMLSTWRYQSTKKSRCITRHINLSRSYFVKLVTCHVGVTNCELESVPWQLTLTDDWKTKLVQQMPPPFIIISNPSLYTQDLKSQRCW